MSRLSQADRALLYACAQFVLAGEWPFECDDNGKLLTDEEVDAARKRLEHVAEKLWKGR